MKFASFPYLRKTRICSSTTGPHSWLWHSRGVAKDTIVGRPLEMASAIVTSCIGHAGFRVQISSTLTFEVTTGLLVGFALVPTAAGMGPVVTGSAETPAR